MADVHPFPTKINGEAVKRLSAKLRSAFEAGEDPPLKLFSNR
jgi:hypothetical protein